MKSIEVTGKSLNEAKSAAAEKLGVSVDELQVEVLDESKGLFGKTNFRIKASVADEAATPVKASKSAKPTRASSKPEKPAKSEPKAEEAPEPAKPSRSAKAEKPAERAKPRTKAVVETTDDEELAEEVVATAEDADRMLGIVERVLTAGDLTVTAKVKSFTGKYVSIELDGKDVSVLVGKNGEVLNALQYLVNIINNQQHGKGVRITLDGNQFRERRESALTKYAHSIAEQVRERGEEALLEALPAYERRIIHKALSELEGVTTYSEGEEPNRRVVIAPAE